MCERKAEMHDISPVTVQQMAETVFESGEIALKWLERPVNALGGYTPASSSEQLKDAGGFVRFSPKSKQATSAEASLTPQLSDSGKLYVRR